MWPDIILSISMAIGESVFTSFLAKKNRAKFQTKLEKICLKKFNDFADSSLDKPEFYNFVKSEKFIIMLRNFYYAVSDGKPRNEFLNYICSVAEKSCPNSNSIDINRFFRQTDELFCEELHKVIKDNNELNALLILLTVSNRTIIQKICESEDNLIKYLSSASKEIFEFKNELIDIYHKNCMDDFSTINFSGIVGAEIKKSRTLEELYVRNHFHLYSKGYDFHFEENNDESECTSYIDISNFFDYGNRIVILGGAGFGKTTSLNYIFCNYEELFKTTALKIKINLKEYATSISSNEADILDCLCKEFTKHTSHAKLEGHDIKLILSKYLDNGKCLIIFDALDEIPSQAMRNRTRDEISNFCNVYYLNRFIITAREIGYLRNKFNDNFLHLKINLFSEKQIAEYSWKWFTINSSEENFDDFYERFNLEVEKSKCQQLIKNPIILVLALIIFNAENSLPHKRVEFYRKCVETFLISREDRKEAFEIPPKMRDILGDDLIIPKVSYYKFDHTCQDNEYNFDKDELKKAILEAIEVPDERNWIDAVNKFIEYLVERAELVREMDEEQYDFAHKTFNEYFLALYFAKNVENKELIQKLDAWVGDANYDELARLIIEVIIEKNNSTQLKIIMNHLFEKIDSFMKGIYSSNNSIDYYYLMDKASSYSRILFNLFSSGLIQPKFQNQYNSCLLRYPMIIGEGFTRTKPIMVGKVEAVYDKDDCWNLFCENIKNNEIRLASAVSIIYFFRESFYQYVDRLENDFLAKTLMFLYIFIPKGNYDELRGYERKHKREKAIEAVEYYLEHNFEKASSSPEIYLLVLKILLLINEQDNEKYTSKMLSFSFAPVNLFTSFISPKMFYKMLKSAFSSPESFLVALTSLIRCGIFRINFLLNFALDTEERQNQDKSDNETSEIKLCALRFKSLFTDVESEKDFIKKVSLLGVYSCKYDSIYSDLYNLFISYGISDSFNSDKESKLQIAAAK